MRAERLFRALGLVDPALVEEAMEVPARRQIPWRRWGAFAAGLALAVGLGFGWRLSGGLGGYGDGMSGSSGGGCLSGDPSEDSRDGGSGVEDGLAFMSYAGPVLPLATAEDFAGLTAERETVWDFAPGTYEDGSPRQWGAEVTDAYVLHNSTDRDITAAARYPFPADFDSLAKIRPAVTVDGEAAETTLYAGAYSGGFQSTFGAAAPDTMNLDDLNSWTEYRALLEDGAYIKQAMAAYPVLDIPVTVYEFSDFAAPLEEYPAATQAVSFDISPEKTRIFTYGFNGMDEDGGSRRYSYFVPDGVRNEPERKVLVVLGEDVGDYTLQGYQNGGCDAGEEIAGVSCAVTRTETTFDVVLERLCRDYQERYSRERAAGQGNAFEQIPFAMYQGAVSELLAQYGLLAGEPVDRYSDGRLDDILSETLHQDRVLYLAFPVTVPAGGSVSVACRLWKEPSFDFACSGSEREGLQGYDLVTRLGSGLTFTAQRAVLVNTEGMELTEQNFGFDLENGETAVDLDLEQEHYYLSLGIKE